MAPVLFGHWAIKRGCENQVGEVRIRFLKVNIFYEQPLAPSHGYLPLRLPVCKAE